MTNKNTSQDDLIKAVKDPETIKKAVEGSMEKRLANTSIREKIVRLNKALANYYNGDTVFLGAGSISSKEHSEKLESLIQQEIREARINELTLLDNEFEEVTPDKFHDYYISRIQELQKGSK